MEKVAVLILCPSPTGKGGIATYYEMFRKYCCSDRLAIQYHYTGKDAGSPVQRGRIAKSVYDVTSFLRIVRDHDLVVINTSLDARGLIRDAVYHAVAKRIFRKKTVVFFHAWFPDCQELIGRHARRLFRFLFNFDRGVVLAGDAKATLAQWGYAPERITLATTMYEPCRATGVRERLNMVFLSRFVPGKGCLEAIKTAELLVGDYPQLQLFMAGDGVMEEELKAYVAAKGLQRNVLFTGWIEGERKTHLLSECSIMLFPTCYGEGMPITILEGMGMGLVVVTRPVAGIPDAVVDGENGFLVPSTEPADFASKVKSLWEDRDLLERMARANAEKAAGSFTTDIVVDRMESTFLEAVTEEKPVVMNTGAV